MPASDPGHATPLDPRSTRVDALMSRQLHVVRESTTIAEAAQVMLDAGVTGLPVIDGSGAPVGVLSLRDVVRAGGKDCAACAADAPTVYFGSLALDDLEVLRDVVHHGEVREVMSTSVLVCKRGQSVAEVAWSMTERGVHRLLVVDDGKLIGLISALDIVAYVAGRKAHD